MNTITAKEVFIFADVCEDIQRENINQFKTWIKDKQYTKKQKYIMKQEIKRCEAKIDYLENTKSIVTALFQKNSRLLKVTEQDKANIKEKYNLGGEN